MGGTVSNWRTRKLHTPSLQWLADFLSLYSAEEISLPAKYRDRVIEVKDLLDNDTSGMACSVLDFCVNCALVEYTVGASNPNLTKILNDWLGDVNSDLRGKIPVGIKSLAKEYFRERWKGSSLLLLRTIWDENGDYTFPTKLWFVEGEDIEVKDGDGDAVRLGEFQYHLRISPKKKWLLPRSSDEMIFVQKPFESWGCKEPIPFLIKRGVWRNIKFLELLEKKGEKVVGRALEYLMMLKKGSERAAIEGGLDFIYDEKDLELAKKDFETFLAKRKVEKGTDFYATGFDTEIEHLIPEYARILRGELYSPIEKRIMAGLGLVEIREGIAGTRRESIINPKPLVAEITQAVDDFKTLLQDIMEVIIEKNAEKHRKYFTDGKLIKIYNTPVKEFLTDDAKTLLRGVYDRGRISSQTFVELVGNVDWNVEVKRREQEKKDGIEEKMFPPVTQNREDTMYMPDFPDETKVDLENVDKKTPQEKKNFKEGDYEEAPYTMKDFPPSLKNLPKGAIKIWVNTFNAVYRDTKDETQARMAAWSNVKNKYKKVGDKWVRRTAKGEEE